jgi:hypothetical protein
MNIMELPPGVEYVEDANLFIWRPHGVLSEALVNPDNRFSQEAGKDAGPVI